jgi:hypothetical protein
MPAAEPMATEAAVKRAAFFIQFGGIDIRLSSSPRSNAYGSVLHRPGRSYPKWARALPYWPEADITKP